MPAKVVTDGLTQTVIPLALCAGQFYLIPSDRASHYVSPDKHDPGRRHDDGARAQDGSDAQRRHRGWVRYVITGRQGTQTVFAYVTDQRQQPVQGAIISLVVHYQSGDQRYEFEPTNASGFTRRSFDIFPLPPGQKVVIDVTTTYGDLTATTQAFFLPWW